MLKRKEFVLDIGFNSNALNYKSQLKIAGSRKCIFYRKSDSSVNTKIIIIIIQNIYLRNYKYNDNTGISKNKSILVKCEAFHCQNCNQELSSNGY